MWRMQFQQWGEPEDLERVELPEPAAPADGVVIDVAAVGCNFSDILIGQGKYQVKPTLPFAPGSEIAGTVRAVGPDVTDLTPGTRVLALLPYGGYASAAVAKRAQVFPIPDSMPADEAACLGVAYQTAYLGLLDRGALKAGETLLVHAAAGGVGLAAVQVGKALGARVIATAGSEEKLALAKAHGADEGLNYRAPDWHTQVLALTGGRGADVVYDPVGGDVFHLSTKCIAFDGRIVVIGFASGTIPEVKLNRVMLKNIAVTGLHIWAYREHAPERLASAMRALIDLYGDGKIRLEVSQAYALQDAPLALRALASRKTVGKLVLKP